MSMGFLLQAQRDHLRQALLSLIPGGDPTRAANYVGIQPDGRPPPTMGDWYAAIDEASVESSHRSYLGEVFHTEVTITRRASQHARDRYEDIYLNTINGLDVIERAIIQACHCNQDLRQRANALAGSPDPAAGDIFQIPLFYGGRGRTRTETGEWIGAEPDRGAFLIRVLPFAGGNRVQALDIQH